MKVAWKRGELLFAQRRGEVFRTGVVRPPLNEKNEDLCVFFLYVSGSLGRVWCGHLVFDADMGGQSQPPVRRRTGAVNHVA